MLWKSLSDFSPYIGYGCHLQNFPQLQSASLGQPNPVSTMPLALSLFAKVEAFATNN